MKSLLKILTVLLLLIGSTSLTTQKASAQVGVSFQVFYDNLSPYGSWVDNPSYGYVWLPSVGPGFSPYATAGHWVFTPYGWTWVSDYPWGWAPFHYGSWYMDPFYGWMWVPATVWAPAWVVWNSAPGYYGWAPMEPGWNVDLVVRGHYRIPPERWVFVPQQDIDRPDVTHYYGPRSENEKILSNATIINRTSVDDNTHAKYIAGPDKSDVEKKTGKQIQPVQVKQLDKPGQKLSSNELAVYRPQVQKTNANGEKPAPKKVVPLKDVQPAGKEQANPSKNVENGKEVPAQNKNQPKQQQENPKNATPENKTPKDNPAHDKDQQQPPKESSPGSTNAGQDQTPAKQDEIERQQEEQRNQDEINKQQQQQQQQQQRHSNKKRKPK